ncbi:hypothetical protein HC864_00770 [Candidatus Gracilibacteria bacterium]|nr:hypothetical protein [Candidatus Gracilibacteria bacterium]
MKRILLIRQGNKTSTNSTISSKRKDLVMSELGKSQVRLLTKYFSEIKKSIYGVKFFVVTILEQFQPLLA